ncbi:MAG: amidohydrolase family protein [Variibacter sp.]
MVMVEERTRPRSESALKVIDCDVHPTLRGGLAAVYPYMPKAWVKRFQQKKASAQSIALTMKYQHPNGSAIREDTRDAEGNVGGSDPKVIVSDLIEPHNIEAAVLNCLQCGGTVAALASTDEGTVIASAFNDAFINEWLPADKRLRYALTVGPLDPAAGAAEIRRVGKHPQIAAVSMPLINILMGNRYWWPIYEAAVEYDLPILAHPSGTDSIYQGTPISAGGIPDSYFERYVTLCQIAESSVNSLVCSGTLEHFPTLKVMFAEFGFTWLLPLLWRMDRTWRQLRHETPWVKKSPIEYVHGQVRFTTQPLDEPDNPADLGTLIGLMGADVLCFSTDYPHWDNDMPEQSLRMLSVADRRKIFYDNAAQFLRLG